MRHRRCDAAEDRDRGRNACVVQVAALRVADQVGDLKIALRLPQAFARLFQSAVLGPAATPSHYFARTLLTGLPARSIPSRSSSRRAVGRRRRRAGNRSSSSAQFTFRDLQKGNRRNSACRLIEMKIDSGLQRSKNQFVASQRTK